MCSLGAQTVKNLSAVQETQVRSLCQEDPLEEETATHSSILACGIPWATVHRSQRVGRDLVMKQQQNPRKGLKASFVPSLGCFISDLKCHRDYAGGFTPWEFLFRQINKKLVALKYVSSHWSPGQAARRPQPGRCGRFQQWLLRGRAGWPGWGAPQPRERLQSMKDDVVMRAKTSHHCLLQSCRGRKKTKMQRASVRKPGSRDHSLPSASSGSTSMNSTKHGWNSWLVQSVGAELAHTEGRWCYAVSHKGAEHPQSLEYGQGLGTNPLDDTEG